MGRLPSLSPRPNRAPAHAADRSRAREAAALRPRILACRSRGRSLRAPPVWSKITISGARRSPRSYLRYSVYVEGRARGRNCPPSQPTWVTEHGLKGCPACGGRLCYITWDPRGCRAGGQRSVCLIPPRTSRMKLSGRSPAGWADAGRQRSVYVQGLPAVATPEVVTVSLKAAVSRRAVEATWTLSRDPAKHQPNGPRPQASNRRLE